MDEAKQGQELDRSFDALRRFTERYRADASVRARAAAGDLSDLDLELPAGVEFRVVEQSAGTYYFPMPPGPVPPLSDRELSAVVGGTGGLSPEHPRLSEYSYWLIGGGHAT